MSHLGAIHEWIQTGKRDPHESAPARPEGSVLAAGVQERAVDVVVLNKALRPLLDGYWRLPKKQAIEKFKEEREDVRRIALIRLFSGFEADFQRCFAQQLKSAWDTLDPAGTPNRRGEGILEVLPNSIEVCLRLFQKLEPRFSGSEKDWLDRFRGWRNDVIHGGFIEPVKDDPDNVYHRLKRILSLLAHQC
jgi:hypothetical protein